MSQSTAEKNRNIKLQVRESLPNGDYVDIIISEKMATQSQTIKDLIEGVNIGIEDDATEIGPIPLPNVAKASMEKIVIYLEALEQNPLLPEEYTVQGMRDRTTSLKEWETNFLKENIHAHSDRDMLILASNYLAIQPLLMLCCTDFANLIRGKNEQQLKETFGVTRDFTDEDRRKVREENPWLVEPPAQITPTEAATAESSTTTTTTTDTV